MSLIELFEASTRGGAAALCLTLIIQILAPRPIRSAAIFGSLFFAGAGIYCIVALPVMVELLGGYIVPVKLLGVMSPAFFWLFIQALHNDNFTFKWWMAIPPGIIATTYLICVPFPDFESASKIVQVSMVAILMAHSIYVVRCCIADDLVTSRRFFSQRMAVLVPLMAAAIMGIEILEALETQHPVARIIVGSLALAVGITLTTSISTIRKTLLPVPPQHRSSTQEEGLSAADRIDLGRLRDLMEEGAFLNAGLSIGELAGQMNVPEHRLRKLINSGLGYRNFAAFLNDHRIDEAKRRLARPTFAREQITSLAFDLGYASLAPFNRAFRERTGKSPTEYREDTLNKA
ncbi:MAG: AraC family transcriptional regulator [Pseudomonadota bacterium]